MARNLSRFLAGDVVELRRAVNGMIWIARSAQNQAPPEVPRQYIQPSDCSSIETRASARATDGNVQGIRFSIRHVRRITVGHPRAAPPARVFTVTTSRPQVTPGSPAFVTALPLTGLRTSSSGHHHAHRGFEKLRDGSRGEFFAAA
jgi:hypothetical protein